MELSRIFEKKAETDGQFAIAHALMQVALALDMLGTNRAGRANMAQGTTEFIGLQLAHIAEALTDRG